jgi:hypothetical protein
MILSPSVPRVDSNLKLALSSSTRSGGVTVTVTVTVSRQIATASLPDSERPGRWHSANGAGTGQPASPTNLTRHVSSMWCV